MTDTKKTQNKNGKKKDLVSQPMTQKIDFTEWLKVNKIKKYKKQNPKHKKTVNYSKNKK